MSPFLAAALDYAARRLPVFPCAPREKLPAIRKWKGQGRDPGPGWRGNGVSDASTDPRLIRNWWGRMPDANIGLACGHGLWVADIDGPDAAAFLICRGMHFRESVPMTCTVRTRGGFHLYWQGDGPPKNGAPARVRALPGEGGAKDGYRRPKGFDTRVRGGYVLAPPSVHPSGLVYDWAVSREGQVLDLSALAAPPCWLLEALTPLPEPPRPAPRPVRLRSAVRDGAGRAVQAAQRILDKHCELVYAAPGGERHQRLRDSAYRIGGLVNAGWLTFGEAFAALEQAGRSGYQDKGGVWDEGRRAVLRSGLEKGPAWSPQEAEGAR